MTGMVLGSGLGPLAHAVDVVRTISFTAAGLPASTVPGHDGVFIEGRLGGEAVLLMKGRVHLYEGHSAGDVTAGVRWMAAAGIKRLILTNAAGTLNPAFPPGSWMMLSDHLNLTGTSPLSGAEFVDMTSTYDAELRARFRVVAETSGVTLHEGVYAGLRGPQYETPAEIRMLRVLGADAVGMSTVLESIQARALGIPVAAFSCLTNWAAGMSGQTLAHHEVLETGRQSADQMIRLLRETLSTQAS